MENKRTLYETARIFTRVFLQNLLLEKEVGIAPISCCVNSILMLGREAGRDIGGRTLGCFWNTLFALVNRLHRQGIYGVYLASFEREEMASL